MIDIRKGGMNIASDGLSTVTNCTVDVEVFYNNDRTRTDIWVSHPKNLKNWEHFLFQNSCWNTIIPIRYFRRVGTFTGGKPCTLPAVQNMINLFLFKKIYSSFV